MCRIDDKPKHHFLKENGKINPFDIQPTGTQCVLQKYTGYCDAEYVTRLGRKVTIQVISGSGHCLALYQLMYQGKGHTALFIAQKPVKPSYYIRKHTVTSEVVTYNI